jgi:hypothetical protein
MVAGLNNSLFTTLEGLKRRAKKLSRTTGVPHHEALEQLAQAGGYRDYRQARTCLQTEDRSENMEAGNGSR